MQLGLVIGTANATVKHPSLDGRTILIVQPRLVDGSADGDPVLAVDTLGAGNGETVLLTSDGRSAREFLGVDATPVRWTTIAIQDPR